VTEEEIKTYQKTVSFYEYIRHKALEEYNFRRRMPHFERHHHKAAACLEREYPDFPDTHIRYLRWKLGEETD